MVKKVLEGKPFAKAGVREGDRVLTVNGDEVAGSEAFRKRLRKETVLEKAIKLQLWRGDKAVEVTVKLGE
jgi:S1-C subfamily serine protease